MTDVKEFTVDPDNAKWDEGTIGSQRLRIGGFAEKENLKITLGCDLFASSIFGSWPDLADEATVEYPRSLGEKDAFMLREAYVSYLSPIGLIRAGQMASNFGLGILANNGMEGKGSLFKTH